MSYGGVSNDRRHEVRIIGPRMQLKMKICLHPLRLKRIPPDADDLAEIHIALGPDRVCDSKGQ
jgi:hypothetical protein